jgi:hypothetical protein
MGFEAVQALTAAASSAHPWPDRHVADLSQERIKPRPVLGLINEYERTA